MRYLKKLFSCILLLCLFALAGCSGSSGGSVAANPFDASTSGTGTGNGTTPITAQDPTFNLALKTDLVSPTPLTGLPRIDANNGTVLLTAQCLSIQGGVLIDPNAAGGDLKIDPGAPSPNNKIYYKIIAGPGSITYPQYPNGTPVDYSVTDNNGKAEAIYTAGNVLITTNVIIEATTTIGSSTYRAYTQFQIVRGSGVITFITSKSASDPDGTMNTLSKTVNTEFAGSQFEYMQSVPFKVTDSNGNPRVGVPVTLSIDNQLTKTATIRINKEIVTTDSAGSGIFNIGVKMTAPPPNVLNTDSIIYKAVTNDDTNPLVAYGGFIASLTTGAPKPITIDPSSMPIYYSDTDLSGAKLYFTISGGVTPYTVTSTVPAWVSVTLLPDGHTVEATLIDASLWNGGATFTVRDAYGNTAASTPTIYRRYSGSVYVSPSSANFTATDVAGATLNFVISGGYKPYAVTSSNPSRVNVVLQPDGVTAVATLVDASLWTGSVTFTASDKNGTSSISTPNIYRK